VQKVYDPRGKLKETSSGTVALSAPRLFRWQYAKPFEQLIIADGHKVWIYDPTSARSPCARKATRNATAR
jgi:outer membrane lipoprotein carrier protein